jgi:hypothetical protein
MLYALKSPLWVSRLEANAALPGKARMRQLVSNIRFMMGAKFIAARHSQTGLSANDEKICAISETSIFPNP